ncbi:AGR286Cp [Eremothecium gossypii ATCC 10895]|uniref:AGR286Cp n=1 Tax=Eremothecium gossypii (strain ATCC 10895 / CBS 109.51 / FGSC 9923 / NRRL Y-1056) TaxID=284811 RepID=Q74ZB3_EREGS|nr:AGR286Cp [Eremothecium gossypii ATCC 10895]AAS54776.1 AGR286Cp [Eremothecium gossypii ATCC 10895]
MRPCATRAVFSGSAPPCKRMTERQDMAEELGQLLASFRERFAYGTRDELAAISSSTQLQDSTPLLELAKLAKLIRAQTTKVGILSQPARREGNESTCGKELRALEESLFYLLSLLPSFHKSGHYTSYLNKQLDEEILALLRSLEKFYDEIREKEENLVSVGKIWASCDELLALAEQGNLGLLNERLSASAKLVQDTILELHDWLAEPTLEEQDPFGLEDSFEETSDAESTATNAENKAPSPQMIEYVQTLERRVKLVKLLLKSFQKSVKVENPHTKAAADSLEKVYKVHHAVVEQIDELVSSVFMLGADFDPQDEDLLEGVKTLHSTMESMCKLVKKLNNNDPKKNAWVESWEAQWNKL